MSGLDVPSLAEIDRLSTDLGFPFPASYRRFVEAPDPETLQALQTICPKGWFVRSKEELGELAAFLEDLVVPIFIQGDRDLIAEVKAGDFETPSGLHAYGFDLEIEPEAGEEPRLVVFSIHTVVAQWTTFPEWAEWMEWLAFKEARRESRDAL